MIDHSELVALAQRSGVKVETIVKRHKKTAIPGIMIIDNRYRVMEGTRYPYSMSGKKIKASSEKKRFYLFEAISLHRYIDAEMLGVEQREFDRYIEEFLQKRLIQRMNWENQYGANGYITTPRGDQVFTVDKNEQMLELARIMGTAVGTAIGTAAGAIQNA